MMRPTPPFLPALALAIFLTPATSNPQIPLPFPPHHAHLKCTHNPPGPLNPLLHQTLCALPISSLSPLPIPSPSLIPSPWSYPPYCTPPSASAHPQTQPLCAYTVRSLRGGPSFSIVTTPSVAAELAPTLQDPDIAWLEKERGVPLSASPDRPYAIRSADPSNAKKGLGVFATRMISSGEILMVNLPLLVRMTDQKGWPERRGWEVLSQASMRLGEGEKRALLGLARSGEGFVVEDILRTNVFHVVVGGVGHTGLFAEVARINHHCRPNAFVRYSPTTLAVEAVAYRDIQPGEEVSLSYLPLNLLSHQRAQLIQEWGFNCTCSLCSDAEASRVSDINRDRIQDILESFDHLENRTQEKVRAALEEAEDLGKKEGLAGQMGDVYSIFADIYLDMGDVKNARKYGRIAVKMLRHYAGYDNMRTDSAVAFMAKLDKLETSRKAT